MFALGSTRTWLESGVIGAASGVVLESTGSAANGAITSYVGFGLSAPSNRLNVSSRSRAAGLVSAVVTPAETENRTPANARAAALELIVHQMHCAIKERRTAGFLLEPTVVFWHVVLSETRSHGQHQIPLQVLTHTHRVASTAIAILKRLPPGEERSRFQHSTLQPVPSREQRSVTPRGGALEAPIIQCGRSSVAPRD